MNIGWTPILDSYIVLNRVLFWNNRVAKMLHRGDKRNHISVYRNYLHICPSWQCVFFSILCLWAMSKAWSPENVWDISVLLRYKRGIWGFPFYLAALAISSLRFCWPRGWIRTTQDYQYALFHVEFIHSPDFKAPFLDQCHYFIKAYLFLF